MQDGAREILCNVSVSQDVALKCCLLLVYFNGRWDLLCNLWHLVSADRAVQLCVRNKINLFFQLMEVETSESALD